MGDALILVGAGIASLALDQALHARVVFPWHVAGVGLSVGALAFVVGLAVLTFTAVKAFVSTVGGHPVNSTTDIEPEVKDQLATAIDSFKRAPRGMTLIEILVVIAIIGIVATVVAVGVVGYLADAKKQATKTLVTNVSTAAGSYAVTHKRLPKDLNELVERKFIKKNQTRDPWDHELSYQAGTSGEVDDFKLCSNGPDGTSGNDDDICSNSEDKD